MRISASYQELCSSRVFNQQNVFVWNPNCWWLILGSWPNGNLSQKRTKVTQVQVWHFLQHRLRWSESNTGTKLTKQQKTIADSSQRRPWHDTHWLWIMGCCGSRSNGVSPSDTPKKRPISGTPHSLVTNSFCSEYLWIIWEHRYRCNAMQWFWATGSRIPTSATFPKSYSDHEWWWINWWWLTTIFPWLLFNFFWYGRVSMRSK